MWKSVSFSLFLSLPLSIRPSSGRISKLTLFHNARRCQCRRRFFSLFLSPRPVPRKIRVICRGEEKERDRGMDREISAIFIWERISGGIYVHEKNAPAACTMYVLQPLSPKNSAAINRPRPTIISAV